MIAKLAEDHKEKPLLFHVQMTVRLPHEMPSSVAENLKAEEKRVAQRLQEQGEWRHLWRVAGRYANVSVFDVDSPARLHEIISGLPLFPFMEIEVVPLCRHASSIRDDDR